MRPVFYKKNALWGNDFTRFWQNSSCFYIKFLNERNFIQSNIWLLLIESNLTTNFDWQLPFFGCPVSSLHQKWGNLLKLVLILYLVHPVLCTLVSLYMYTLYPEPTTELLIALCLSDVTCQREFSCWLWSDWETTMRWRCCCLGLFLVLAQEALTDNLEDLMIIDSLLKEYDRRATPTNRMGKKQIWKK